MRSENARNHYPALRAGGFLRSSSAFFLVFVLGECLSVADFISFMADTTADLKGRRVIVSLKPLLNAFRENVIISSMMRLCFTPSRLVYPPSMVTNV